METERERRERERGGTAQLARLEGRNRRRFDSDFNRSTAALSASASCVDMLPVVSFLHICKRN